MEIALIIPRISSVTDSWKITAANPEISAVRIRRLVLFTNLGFSLIFPEVF